MICFHPDIDVETARLALAAAGMVILPNGKGGGTVVTAEMADEINRRKNKEIARQFASTDWIQNRENPED